MKARGPTPCPRGWGRPTWLGGHSTPLGRRPPWRFNLLGPAPPLGVLYIVGGGRAAAPKPLASPSPSRDTPPSPCAWRSPAKITVASTTRRRAAGSSSTSPSPLLDQEGGDVFPTVRVLYAEVLSIRHLVIGDLDHDEYDSINPVLLNASARDLQGYVDELLSPSLLDDSID